MSLFNGLLLAQLSWSRVIFIILSGLILSIFYFTDRPKKRLNFPSAKGEDFDVDLRPGLQKPAAYQWTALMTKAASKFKSPFYVELSGKKEILVLPPNYIEDIKNNKDLNFDLAITMDTPHYVSGFKPVSDAFGSPIFHDAVRIKLTQSLAALTDELNDEAKRCLPELFPAVNDWKVERLSDTIPDLTARLSAVIFLGRDFKHAREWQKIVASFSETFFTAKREFSSYPRWARPFVHWFIPSVQLVRQQRKEACALIEPEIRARQQRRFESIQQGNSPPKRSLDSVDWFEATRKGQLFDIVGGELLLSLVAHDTTTRTLTNAILDIAAYPEVASDMRDEIIQVVREDEGIKKTTLQKAKLLDSFMKESQRLNPIDQAHLQRIALRDVTLHDGTVLPKGTHIVSGPMPHWDSKIFSNPYTFDAYRFLKLRENPGESSKWQYVTTLPEQQGFGHGIHACPGRFFASNEIKTALMHMVMKYDWKLMDGPETERPLSYAYDFELAPDREARVMYKARSSEVDF